jgi:hypothetical protein
MIETSYNSTMSGGRTTHVSTNFHVLLLLSTGP